MSSYDSRPAKPAPSIDPPAGWRRLNGSFRAPGASKPAERLGLEREPGEGRRRQAPRVQPQARPRGNARAVQLPAPPHESADLRRPAPRRATAALRLSAPAARRPPLVARPEGRAARAGPARTRRPRRGSPPRLRDLRGRDPEG